MIDHTNNPNAAIIIIGNEILSGRTVDQNLPFLAKALCEIGITLQEARTIADDEQSIINTINEYRANYEYVFTSGGIGPTHDDVTTSCVAKAFNIPLVLNAEAKRRLTSNYTNEEMNEARLKMAHVPEGATLIDNPISAAPGFRVENVYVMAGVPSILQAMFNGIRNHLRSGPVTVSRSITANIPEGLIATPLANLQNRNRDVEIGSYPFFRDGESGATFVLRCTDVDRLLSVLESLKRLVRDLGHEPFEEDRF